MANVPYPHAFVAPTLLDILSSLVSSRAYTEPPRDRIYPFIVVQVAGVGPIGLTTIRADEPRVQVDCWAETRAGAESLGLQVFATLDERFAGGTSGLKTFTDQVTADVYQTNIERIRRSGSSAIYFDEYAKVFKQTSQYGVKIQMDG